MIWRYTFFGCYRSQMMHIYLLVFIKQTCRRRWVPQSPRFHLHALPEGPIPALSHLATCEGRGQERRDRASEVIKDPGTHVGVAYLTPWRSGSKVLLQEKPMFMD